MTYQMPKAGDRINLPKYALGLRGTVLCLESDGEKSTIRAHIRWDEETDEPSYIEIGVDEFEIINPFTVTCVFYDGWNEQTVIVEAKDYADACEKAIEYADDHGDSYRQKSWDPAGTFVAGVVEGGTLLDNTGQYLDNVVEHEGNVPLRFSENAEMGGPCPRQLYVANFFHGLDGYENRIFETEAQVEKWRQELAAKYWAQTFPHPAPKDPKALADYYFDVENNSSENFVCDLLDVEYA